MADLLNVGSDDPRPSIFDRVLGKLFPARAESYGGLLDEQDIASERRNALSRIGQSLLATGGPHPTGTRNVGQNIGEALGAAKFPEALSEAAQHAAAFKQIASQGAKQRAIQEIASRHPAAANETTEQAMSRFESMIPDLINAGLTDEAGKIQELIIKSRPSADKYTKVGPGETVLGPPGSAPLEPVFQAPAKPTPSEAFDRGTKLRAEFTQNAAEYANVANGYRTLQSFLDEPKRSGTADQGVVFSYMKMLDPRSTLQNGQRADQRNAPGVPKEVMELYNLVLGHETKLTQQQYNDIIAAAKSILKTRVAEFDRLRQRYTTLSTEAGVEPSHVINDYFEGIKDIARAGKVSAEGDNLLNGAK